ncbi:CPBP family intramembrane glutamic endopeptidase [Aphanothece sacrum]|uniref:Abortive phage infection protein n=1 Tax=Aphanothece sacrum FPU1 TaxID=1920663 RepID=A0A401IBU4_APHSA|nr:type II CAAX endopeptidase family protein [Aphanothece sacrum]GBF78712.1 abortive phage infection protein [Aphanothece sacrum FPU1]GBF86941.1 abortive phage infection protein [Aphanothece sacrum FPU3]
MTRKQLVLLVLTLIALIPVLLSLIASINQPQIQANLQLYQTNLVLQASEFSEQIFQENNPNVNIELGEIMTALIGKNVSKNALKQYQEARQLSQNNLDNLENQLQVINPNYSVSNTLISSPNPKQLNEKINKQREAINELDLKLGILEAQEGNTSQSLTTWNNLQSTSLKNITDVVIGLWSPTYRIYPESELIINDNLKGWFRYRILKELYQIEDRQSDLIDLKQKEQQIAIYSLKKLILVSIIPLFLGIIGFGLFLFLMFQLVIKKEQSILFIGQELSWKTPWNFETILQVLIVGFFFFGQIVLPVLFGFLNIDISYLSLRGKAIYVLASYLSLSLGGLVVLYISIKPFFPLPKDWFKFELNKGIVWGISGYLVALPLVVLISLINQQIWNGQGGSNPLLSLALESQDKIVLAIFYITAAIAAPVYEEIMFRGFLLPSLTRYVPVWGAIVISSLIFALAHLNLSEVLPLAVLGIVLGTVYTRSRNLLSSMLLHSLWNSGTLFSLFLLGSGGN